MNFIKASILVTALSSVFLSSVQANETTTLPTIKVMADSELRDEQVTMTPFQEDTDARKALQHKIIKSEQDIQNNVISDNITAVDIRPQAVAPDMSTIPKAFQPYVLSVAAGLQSSDPMSGIFTILESVGINRNTAVNDVRNGTVKPVLDSFWKGK